MDNNFWFEVFGWAGSILVVLSLMQARVLRFRWMNFIGAAIATIYNFAIDLWPFFAMNLAITIIDAYWLWKLHHGRHDPAVYEVVEVPANDPYLAHVLKVHEKDIAAIEPSFGRDVPAGTPRSTFLVVRGDEAVGVVAVRDEGNGVGLVELDWVKPRFRDFTPGEFVYKHSGALAEAGFQRVEIEPHESTDREYLRKMGFHTDKSRLVREVAA